MVKNINHTNKRKHAHKNDMLIEMIYDGTTVNLGVLFNVLIKNIVKFRSLAKEKFYIFHNDCNKCQHLDGSEIRYNAFIFDNILTLSTSTLQSDKIPTIH